MHFNKCMSMFVGPCICNRIQCYAEKPSATIRAGCRTCFTLHTFFRLTCSRKDVLSHECGKCYLSRTKTRAGFRNLHHTDKTKQMSTFCKISILKSHKIFFMAFYPYVVLTTLIYYKNSNYDSYVAFEKKQRNFNKKM